MTTRVRSILFKESHLRAVAQVLGDTANGLSNSEIDDLLVQCRVPDEFGPATKWKRIFYNLWNHQVRKGTRTYALEFIRQAMSPARYIKNPEQFNVMRASLNKALAFAGLQVNEAGELLSAEKVSTLPEAERRAKELETDLVGRGVHPDVLRFCRAELVQNDYFHAVQEATKSIFDKLRTLADRTDDGATLVDATFLGPNPMMAINDWITESEQAEQRGFANLLKGVYGMFRTTTAHEARINWQMTKDDAEDLMSVASLIHRRLDGAKHR